MTPKEYLKIAAAQRAIIRKAEQVIERAEAKARRCPFPKRLRAAQPKDIRVGAVLWYPARDGDEAFWAIVAEGLRPSDEWKAYVAEDGCRYGLAGAFVEATR